MYRAVETLLSNGKRVSHAFHALPPWQEFPFTTHKIDYCILSALSLTWTLLPRTSDRYTQSIRARPNEYLRFQISTQSRIMSATQSFFLWRCNPAVLSLTKQLNLLQNEPIEACCSYLLAQFCAPSWTLLVITNQKHAYHLRSLRQSFLKSTLSLTSHQKHTFHSRSSSLSRGKASWKESLLHNAPIQGIHAVCSHSLKFLVQGSFMFLSFIER